MTLLKELNRVGVTVDNMVEHINLRNEFCFHRFHKNRVNQPFDPRCDSCVVKDELDPLHMHDEGVKIMTVLDVGGIKLSDVTKDVLMFIKQELKQKIYLLKQLNKTNQKQHLQKIFPQKIFPQKKQIDFLR